MVSRIKQFLYFPIASYFRFFAAIRLKRWNPKIIVVTGSNGKTTLLHLLEAQIGTSAKYSHHANSSYGIPFDVLNLHRKSLLKSEWISLILKTPFSAFRKPPKEHLYVVEADCDRPGEGKFLASFLKPAIVLWISTAKTHSMNFEHLVSRHPGEASTSIGSHKIDLIASLQNDKFNTVEEAIAYEFGYFLQHATELVLIDGDSELMVKQINRTKARIVQIKKEKSLKSYEVSKKGTRFQIALDTRDTLPAGRQALDTFNFKFLLPEEVFYSIEMVRKTCEILNISFDQSFLHFQMPPGRGSIFAGIKNTTIIDSCYNANLSSMKAVLSMYGKFTVKNKWVVLADMLELGDIEKKEHEQLAEIINNLDIEKIILVGRLTAKYTFPKLKDKNNAVSFMNTKDVLPHILNTITGKEVILFKGSQSFYLEGAIAPLLRDSKDSERLPRRGKAWEGQRSRLGMDN